MSDDRFGIGALISLLKLSAWSLVVFVPLGIWKVIDIIIWIVNHAHIGVQ